jgi:hypothetical protein
LGQGRGGSEVLPDFGLFVLFRSVLKVTVEAEEAAVAGAEPDLEDALEGETFGGVAAGLVLPRAPVDDLEVGADVGSGELEVGRVGEHLLDGGHAFGGAVPFAVALGLLHLVADAGAVVGRLDRHDGGDGSDGADVSGPVFGDGELEPAGLVAREPFDRVEHVGDTVDGGELGAGSAGPPVAAFSCFGDVVEEQHAGAGGGERSWDRGPPGDDAGGFVLVVALEGERFGDSVDDDEVGVDGAGEAWERGDPAGGEGTGARVVEPFDDRVGVGAERDEAGGDPAGGVFVVEVQDAAVAVEDLEYSEQREPALPDGRGRLDDVDDVAVQEVAAVAAGEDVGVVGRFVCGARCVWERRSVTEFDAARASSLSTSSTSELARVFVVDGID